MSSGLFVFSLLIPLLLLLVLVAGVVLIFTSRRGGKPHPACGACGYDVTGSVGETSRCSECGAEFKDVGITPPHRTQRPVMMGFGVALIVISLTCFLGMAGSVLFSTSARTVPPPRPAPAPLSTPEAPAPQ